MSVIVYHNNKPVQQESDDWEVKVDCVTACSKAPEAIVVLMEPIVKSKIDALMKKYTNREWLGYFFGKPEEPFHILDMFIPEQVATGTRVDKIEFSVDLIPEGQKVIGVVHSHHTMGVGFSGTDEDFINGNHDISLLVAHSGMKCQVRYTVPCGAKFIKEAKVKLNYIVNYDEKGFLQQAETNIKERSYVNQYTNWQDNYPFTDGNSSWPISSGSTTKSTEELYAGLEKEMSLEEELKSAFNPTNTISDDKPVTDDKALEALEENLQEEDGMCIGPDN